MMKKIFYIVTGILLGAGFTASAAFTTVPLTKNGVLEMLGFPNDSLVIGRTSTTTNSRFEVNGTSTATVIVATSTTADSVFPRLSVTNSTTTNATTTSFFSTLLRATTGYFTSLYLPSLATPTGTLIAVDNNGQVIATTTPAGSGTPGGADTNVQFNDGGTFGGEAGFTYDSVANILTAEGITAINNVTTDNVTSRSFVNTIFDFTSTGAVLTLPSTSNYLQIRSNVAGEGVNLRMENLTSSYDVLFQDKAGTFAYLSDITNASSTLLTDNNTFSGDNIFGGSSVGLFLGGGGISQIGSSYPQSAGVILSDRIRFSFDAAPASGVDGYPIQFVGNSGSAGNSNGSSIEFYTGLPSGTGATGTMKFYTGSDLIFEGASSTVATSTFYSNLHVTGGLKVGDASILLQGNSTSTFSKGIELTGGCFKVAGACLSSGGSGASSTMLADNNTFTGANRFATMLVTGSSTLQNYTGLNATTTNATTTTLAAGTICLTADTCRTTWPTVSGGSGSANATNTIDWIIYPYGSNVAVWRAKTQSAVTTFADFDDAANYVVNLATSSVPAENSIKIGTGVYQVNATTTMDGNGVGFSAVKFFWYGNGTSTMLVVNNNTSAFFMTDRARVHFENIGFNLNGGADAFYASTTQSSPVSSLNESEFFGIKAYSSSINHTGWVFHFKDAFRYHIADFHAKDVGNCFSDENNYSNNAFINGDGQIDGFNFCELNNPTAGVNNGGRVVSLYGRQGLVNQMVLKNINGITNSNNSTMFYINHASRIVIEDNNSEQFATTTDIINSNNVHMKTSKYITPFLSLANATIISTDANSYNNTFSLAEAELSAATYIFKDANTIAPTRPNTLQGYNGGQFTFTDNGGSALWATTTSTVVRDVFDNIGVGANSYLGRVKITGGNIAMDFLNSRTTLFQYANSAYRWLVAGTERMTLSSGGDLTLPTGGFAAYASSSFQNFTALKATTTQATTTTLFATSASTSAFYGAGLSTCNSAANAVTYANGTFGCNSISGSGTVNSGTTGQMPYYAANGTAITATSTIVLQTAETIGVQGTGFAVGSNARFNVRVGSIGQGMQIQGETVSDIGFSEYVTGDGFTRYSVLSDGTTKWGSGALSADVGINRVGAGMLNIGFYGAATAARLGISSTTPGTAFSIGSGANFVNISETGTSTFSDGINLTSGCLTYNGGACITSGAGGSSVGGTGAIQFANGAAFDGDATNFFWDNTNKYLSIGTGTPWANLAVQGTYGSIKELFSLASSTNANGSATTSLFKVMYNGSVGIGVDNPLDKLMLNGAVSTGDWVTLECKAEAMKKTAQITTDITGSVISTTLGYPCGDFSYIEDTNGVANMSISHGSSYIRLAAGGVGTTNLAGDGMGLSLTSGGLGIATNTPTLEVTARLGTVQNASTSLFMIGFGSQTGVTADYAAMTTNYCGFVASSTQANWQALCKVGASITQQNTGVATSSVTTGNSTHLTKFRVQTSATSVKFYIRSFGETNWTLTNTITTNIPTNIGGTALNPVVSVGKASAGLSPEFHVSRIWMPYLEAVW